LLHSCPEGVQSVNVPEALEPSFGNRQDAADAFDSASSPPHPNEVDEENSQPYMITKFPTEAGCLNRLNWPLSS
jgi:hypothetical protein